MKTLTARFLLFAILLGFAAAARSATLLYAVTSDGLLYRSADGAKIWQAVSQIRSGARFWRWWSARG